MSTNYIIPFSDAKSLPAEVRALAGDEDSWESGQVSGFPVISVDGKVFHIIRGEDRTLVTRPDAPDEAAASLELVIIRTHPGMAKVYYEKKYVQGSADKPDCYSNDGKAPAEDAENPQARNCALCPHNQWGSRITENNKKGKSCSDVKRVAVASPTQINDPMLLRVPPTSLKNWDAYVDALKKRGMRPTQLVTKIGFDPTVSYQMLTFKPVGFITADMAVEVGKMRDADVVKNIIAQGTGIPAAPAAPAEPEQAAPAPAPAAPAPAAKQAAKQAAAPKTAPAPAADPLDDLDFGDLVADAPAPTTPAPVAAVATGDSLADELDAMLGDLGFDD